MTTALAKTVVQARPPLLPESLQRLTNDQTDYEGRRLPWVPPRTLPAVRDVREALGTLRVYLTPATDREIGECLARMALVMRAKEGGAAEWRARAGEYIRILTGYPADIWNEVTDKLIASSPFFPTPAELKAPLDAELSLRHRRIKRLEAMIDQPKTAHTPGPRETIEVRLRAVVAAWLAMPEASAGKAALAASAITAERDLAAIEKRAVEGWAA